MVSSISSCFGRFVRPFGLLFGGAERADESLVLGRDSGGGESGDLEVLAEAECAERLPERRVSRGERGGPIVAAWAMVKSKVKSNTNTNTTSSALHLFRAGNPYSTFHFLLLPPPPPRPRTDLSLRTRTVSHNRGSTRDQARPCHLPDTNDSLACAIGLPPTDTAPSLHAGHAGEDLLVADDPPVGAGGAARMHLSYCT